MTLKIRRILFIICFLIFAVSVPVLILYAFGYRYDSGNKSLVKTGALLLKTQPSNVDVYLDGLLQNNETIITPKGIMNKFIAIKGLEPKNYLLETKSEGYHSWSKNLKIQEGLVTKADNIILLLKEPEIFTLSNKAVKNFILSPDKSKLVYSIQKKEKTEIWLIDLKKNEKNAYPVFDAGEAKEIFWSPDSKKIFFSNQIKSAERWFVFDIQKPKNVIGLTKILKKTFKNLIWHPDSNSIFCLINDKLCQIDYQTKKISAVVNDQITTYTIFQNNIYYLEKPTAIIYKTDLKGKNKEQINLTRFKVENLSANPQLIISDKKKIAVLSDSSLYLLNQNSQPVLISDNAKGAEFFPNSSRLLWFTPSEIYVWQPENESEESQKNGGINQLITRYSKEIKKAVWANDSGHIFFIVDKKIKFIETDDRDKRNVFDFIKLKNEDGDLFYDSKNKKLYFLDEGIYWVGLDGSVQIKQKK